MDLLIESAWELPKRELTRLRSLKPLDINYREALSEMPMPSAVHYGRLYNGLTYYVRKNTNPRKRAALALVVNAGSVLEEWNECGVAHILQHLAFRSTTNYTEDDIVKFLESIGADVGACQNSHTSADETVYRLFVPVDKHELLVQAISVLAEFGTEIRVSKEILDKERGTVLKEYRDPDGRLQDKRESHLLQDSMYAERLPIGLETVIQTVSAGAIHKFYEKWYLLENMALICVGDFRNTEDIVDLIKIHFKDKLSRSPLRIPPYFEVPYHLEPHISCFGDPKVGVSMVHVSYKQPVEVLKTTGHYRVMLVKSLFLKSINERFSKICARPDPPYTSCSAVLDYIVRSTKIFKMSSSCKEKGIREALDSMLMEVARVRVFGFLEHEIAIARFLLISDIKSKYLKRDQNHSKSLREEYTYCFLRDEPLIEIEKVVQLYYTILPDITAYEVSAYAQTLRTSNNCVIETIEPRETTTVNQIKSLVSGLNNLEQERKIHPWDEEQIPKEVGIRPSPGSVVQRSELKDIYATKLTLSNGMVVFYKCKDIHEDQVLLEGFSYGGLSEIPEREYLSCLMSMTIAKEIGIFDYKCSKLKQMLAVKRGEICAELGYYTRSFNGHCPPSELETALQFVYQLFTTTPRPTDEDVKIVMQRLKERIQAEESDPKAVFGKRALELNHGNSYLLRPMRISDVEKVDPLRAFEYFSNCFRDPSTFTVGIVGNIDLAESLILHYLGGIPRPAEPILNFNPNHLKAVPFTFPSTVVREVVLISPKVVADWSVELCFPLEIWNKDMLEDEQLVGFLMMLMERQIFHMHDQIYSVGVSMFLDDKKPSQVMRGYISVKFSCDPDLSSTLVDLALDEIMRLQVEGPSDKDVRAILDIEQKNHETNLRENIFWLERIMKSYRSRIYSGNVGKTFQEQLVGRRRVINTFTPNTARLALQRIIPFPCKNHYTVLILMPQPPSLMGRFYSIFAKEFFLFAVLGLFICGVLTYLCGLYSFQEKF